MAVGHSVAATAASRGYLTIVGLLVLPLYLGALGPEAFGLVTLFIMLQVWFQLLDMGLAATLARETARHRAGSVAGPDIRQLSSTLERLFLAGLTLVGLLVFVATGAIAQRWLNLDRLPADAAVETLRLMVACIALRLLGDLYRGTISGHERLAWLAGSNAAFGTLRLLGVLPFLSVAGASPTNFFAFQLAAYALETLVLRTQASRLMPPTKAGAEVWSLKPVRAVAEFSLTMSLASAGWVLISQIDKLILLGLLSLSDFGAYGLAVTAASGVLLATGALADTLVPRIVLLQARAALAELRSVYRRFTQCAVIIATSAGGLLACHAERLLWVWTGDGALAAQMAPVLSLYALGNAALAIGAFPFYLQLARGQLRMHLVGTGLMFALLLFTVAWAAGRYGAVGAAAAWLAVSVLYLVAWTPLAHARFAPGLHWRWLLMDVAPIALLGAVAALATTALPLPIDRIATGLALLGVAAVILLAATAGSDWARGVVIRRLTHSS